MQFWLASDWNENSKDKKEIENAEEDQPTYMTAGKSAQADTFGRQFRTNSEGREGITDVY